MYIYMYIYIYTYIYIAWLYGKSTKILNDISDLQFTGFANQLIAGGYHLKDKQKPKITVGTSRTKRLIKPGEVWCPAPNKKLVGRQSTHERGEAQTNRTCDCI